MGKPKGYQVHEHFWTIQGEGQWMGHTAIFLRLQGCPVGCHWCDSKLTWFKGGTYMSLDDIATTIRGYPEAELLVITGGEPLIHDLDPLIQLIWTEFRHMRVHLETSGARPFKGEEWPDWVTLSPKEAADWYVEETVHAMTSELKFVVDDTFDVSAVAKVREARAKVPTLLNPIPIYLMPEGDPPRPEMVQKTIEILKYMPEWHFSPRLQYDYPDIGKLEGHNNKIISRKEAIDVARRIKTTESTS